MDERRRHVRYPVSVPGRCAQPGQPETSIQVLNLSAASLLARSPQPFLQLKTAHLKVELQEGLVECEAVCVRATTAPPWEGAFLFTEVAPESAERLESFLERLRGHRHT
ncbi:MAG: PilZ domain-containing protein [Acidobacteriota bacterium]